MKTAGSALSSTFQWPPGKAPLVATIAEPIMPPKIRPLVSGCFMLRER